MAPTLRKTAPFYEQIAQHYRARILSGELPERTKLPAIRQIAEDWGTTTATVQKAFGVLRVEELIWSSTQGTYVSDTGRVQQTPRDRIETRRRIGRALIAPEQTVRLAEVIPAPNYVADLFGEEPGWQVIHREWVTTRHGRPTRLAVSWHRPEFADAVPELLYLEPLPDEPVILIARATGRRVTHLRESSEAREAADAREANALQVPIGATVHAVVATLSDADGVIEYVEFIDPRRHVITNDAIIDLGED